MPSGLGFPRIWQVLTCKLLCKAAILQFTATKTYGSTSTRALSPDGVSVGSASIVVRIVGIRLTPTTHVIPSFHWAWTILSSAFNFGCSVYSLYTFMGP